MKLVAHVDGGSRGNPGPAAAGAVLSTPEGEVVDRVSEFVGLTTNNVAEYRALLLGVRRARELGATEVEVVNDSELIAKQVNGQYKVKHADMKPLHAESLAALSAVRPLDRAHRAPRAQRRRRRTRQRGTGCRALSVRHDSGMSAEHVDVLIVGAGISGIGAGYHLQADCPGKSYAILESRDGIGGTWDLFRYPGIRSDSDMFTLGYSFRPWKEAKAIADGPSIRTYVRETASENGIDRHIRFNHRVVRATWSTAESRWSVGGRADRHAGGRPLHLRVPLHVHRLLPLRRRLHARLRRRRGLRRERSSTRSTGRRTSTTPASASW